MQPGSSVSPSLMQSTNIYIASVPQQTGQDAQIQYELRAEVTFRGIPVKPMDLCGKSPNIELTIQTSASTPTPQPYVSFQNSNFSRQNSSFSRPGFLELFLPG